MRAKIPLEELRGQKFGRLTIESEAFSKGERRVLCNCDCGKQKEVRLAEIKRGRTSSCGCLHKENFTKRNTTHGQRKTTTYSSWSDMLKRCYNKKSTHYENYGGRGISVCKPWHRFEDFLRDMGHRPHRYSLERIDVNRNYYPANCKWIPIGAQARNKTTTAYVYINGTKHDLIDTAKILGVTYWAIRSRRQRFLKKNPNKKHYKIRTEK